MRVIAAASTDEKLALARAHGADMGINYATADLKAELKRLVPGGVDVVYDPVGGALTEAAVRGMAWGGRLLIIGFANGEIPKLALNLLLLREGEAIGVFWGSFTQRYLRTRHAENTAQLMQWFNDGKLQAACRRHLSAWHTSRDALADVMERQRAWQNRTHGVSAGPHSRRSGDPVSSEVRGSAAAFISQDKPMNFDFTPKVKDYQERVSAFMDKHIYPERRPLPCTEVNTGDRWEPTANRSRNSSRSLKSEGLWNLFLPRSGHGPGLTNLEYAPLAEIMGRVEWASEVFNCSAPDTGNMETIERYGSEEQKAAMAGAACSKARYARPLP